MKKIIIMLAICASITSCMEFKPAQSIEIQGNGFQVELLFQQDSVKV